jgi:predicted  nucleic acid-binding Zn-ribbon protein
MVKYWKWIVLGLFVIALIGGIYAKVSSNNRIRALNNVIDTIKRDNGILQEKLDAIRGEATDAKGTAEELAGQLDNLRIQLERSAELNRRLEERIKGSLTITGDIRTESIRAESLIGECIEITRRLRKAVEGE